MCCRARRLDQNTTLLRPASHQRPQLPAKKSSPAAANTNFNRYPNMPNTSSELHQDEAQHQPPLKTHPISLTLLSQAPRYTTRLLPRLLNSGPKVRGAATNKRSVETVVQNVPDLFDRRNDKYPAPLDVWVSMD
ncbi:uncharacterized protein SPPG_09091 [Spizellomyces punctatus DAOM BR117]|uniref:Uncharacterized protein n=1 Tax=Spizellomyces punctatus (strain DAOM BR117) TaxID=645134 RepID=A0A0L0HIP6_SPIPD|nr:uncharacterized protein SPPG_09091 [Spizellomyces punctatus DAOM BR117]KND01331.1 hypothetical protein SPPG_09091 [Spizellomyces punctatus DAOM BR117]|eukprot:XP_016609370.1 hypothetical protein SPPG_09091 [Spizellomyces punctatus DAOM BR117]